MADGVIGRHPGCRVNRLVKLFTALFRRHWRAALSIAAAATVFFFALAGSLRFHNELRWYTLGPFYKARLASKTPDGRYHMRSLWWDGGNGWDVSLEYHETEADARAWQKLQDGLDGGPPCRRSLVTLEQHYFLNGMHC